MAYAGQLIENPRSGERITFRETAADTGGERLVVDVELTPLITPSVGGLESRVADRDELERGFIRLEPEMRAVIVLHHFLDLPLRAVASTLGIPLGTAKSRLHRALAQMRAALDADTRGRSELTEGRPA